MKTLVFAYRAWPFRPHCGAARHVTLCRWVVPHLTGVTCDPRPGGSDPW